MTSLLPDPTDDPLVSRVLVTLLAMQRYSWEQGVATHALLGALAVLVVTHEPAPEDPLPVTATDLERQRPADRR